MVSHVVSVKVLDGFVLTGNGCLTVIAIQLEMLSPGVCCQQISIVHFLGEIVLFCRPTDLQLRLYQHLLQSQLVRSCLSRCLSGSPHLICIAALKQLCNHSSLVYHKALSADDDEDDDDNVWKFILKVSQNDKNYLIVSFVTNQFTGKQTCAFVILFDNFLFVKYIKQYFQEVTRISIAFVRTTNGLLFSVNIISYLFNPQMSVYSGLSPLYPVDYNPDQNLECWSGKLAVLSSLLHQLHTAESQEKIVVVSNHTKVFIC